MFVYGTLSLYKVLASCCTFCQQFSLVFVKCSEPGSDLVTAQNNCSDYDRYTCYIGVFGIIL